MLPPVAGMVSAAIVAPSPASKTNTPNHSRMGSLLEPVISGFSFLVFKSFVFDAVKAGRLPQRCQLCCYATQERPPQSECHECKSIASGGTARSATRLNGLNGFGFFQDARPPVRRSRPAFLTRRPAGGQSAEPDSRRARCARPRQTARADRKS